MRHFAGAFVCALFVLGLAREAAQAQSTASTTASKFETEPFSGAELLRGKRITQAECAALPGAVWAAVDQQGECIRYYHSTAGGSGSEVSGRELMERAIASVIGYLPLAAPRMKPWFLSMVIWETPKRRAASIDMPPI
jgi:hypothetical protein